MEKLVDSTRIASIIGQSFRSVFDSIDIATESWFQKKRIFNFSKESYTNWMCEEIGSYPLFGTNRTINVEDSFVPIALTNGLEKEVYKNVEEIEKELISKKDENDSLVVKKSTSLLDTVNQFGSGIALLGLAGTGKTTALKHLAITCAKGEVIFGSKRFPIFISVRELIESPTSLWDSMENYLERFDINKPKAVLWSLLKSGQAMVLVDGIDETTETHRNFLVKEISRLQAINKRRKKKNNVICVSGRPHSLSIGLVCFTKFEITPLDIKQQNVFIEKWFAGVSDKKGRKLSKIIESNKVARELGTTPLLLSLICALYDNELDIAKREEELFERALLGLLGGWDHFRGVVRNTFLENLSITKCQVFVAKIAFGLFTEKKIVFTVHDLEESEIVKTAFMLINRPFFDEYSTTQCLYNDFGLFTERSPGLFSFLHLSFQEYLTAKYATDARLELELAEQMLKSPDRYFDVIKYLAYLLPRADSFLEFFNRNNDWSNIVLVRLFSTFWKADPICSVEVRTRILTSILSKVVRFIKESNISSDNVTFCFGSDKFVFKNTKKITVEKVNNLILFLNDIKANLNDENLNKEFSSYLKRNSIHKVTGAVSYEQWTENSLRNDAKDLWGYPVS